MNIEQEVGSDLSNADIADDLVIFEGFCRHWKQFQGQYLKNTAYISNSLSTTIGHYMWATTSAVIFDQKDC